MGVEGYTTSKLEDNCIWVYFEYATLEVLTRLSKTFATCGLNLRDVAHDLDSWQSVLNRFLSDPLFFFKSNKCRIDEVNGRVWDKLDGLSGSLLIPFENLDKLNRDKFMLWSYCGRDVDLNYWFHPHIDDWSRLSAYE